MKYILKKVLCVCAVILLQVFWTPFINAMYEDDLKDVAVLCAYIKSRTVPPSGDALLTKHSGELVMIRTSIRCREVETPAWVRYIHKIPFINPADSIAYELVIICNRADLQELCRAVESSPNVGMLCRFTVQIDAEQGFSFEFDDYLDLMHDRLEDVLRSGIILYSTKTCASITPVPLSRELLISPPVLKVIKQRKSVHTSTTTTTTVT